MSSRLIVVPRWAGGPASDWYPWLSHRLRRVQPRPFEHVVLASMPDPGEPTIAKWVASVKTLLGHDPKAIAQTVLVGHSVGCQAVLRALAELDDGITVGGVLCVAGWFWTDAPWASLLPWIEAPFALDRARAAAGRQVITLISDNDPHTGDWQANRRAWEDRLGASVLIVPGARHFNGEQYPIVEQVLLDHFGAA